MTKELHLNGVFEISPRETILYEASLRYHRVCEEYDRRVCSGPIIDGSIRPSSPWEHGLINRHALETLRSIALDMGIERRELVRAIQKYCP